jgi:hypothetical protein
LQGIIDATIGAQNRGEIQFEADPDRLRNELIALTVTGQVSNLAEELIFPWLKTQFWQWWRERQASKTHLGGDEKENPHVDDPAESRFLRRARKQALREPYNVQDDISEMVIQFGFLALFSPVWPLVPIGFFINNWFELRTDFLKICVEHQRPDPVRSEGLGPWVASLDGLTWFGSITSAAIVHLFGTTSFFSKWLGLGLWASLPITILVSEHIFMAFRTAVRFGLSRYGSEQTRKENAERFAKRKKYLDELEEKDTPSHLDVGERERRKSVRIQASDMFWTKQAELGASADAGVQIIKAARSAREEQALTGRAPKLD